MASSINASTTAGVVTTADTSGVLNIQTAGTTAIAIDASQAVSFTNSPTVTGGTANGVAYLNGSKVLTTGSALSFDGSVLATSVSGSTALTITSSASQAYINLRSVATAGFEPFIGFGDASAGNIAQMLGINGGGLRWTTAGTERMRLDASGNLGVGTTSPAAKTEIVAGTGAQYIGTFRTGDSTTANNAGGGFYGVSSATAASRQAIMWLDADGANFAGGDYFYIVKAGNSGNVDLIQASNAAMTFQVNGAERARIDSSGNLLVGTTSGGAKIVALQTAAASYGSDIRCTSATYTSAVLNIGADRNTTDGTYAMIQATRYGAVTCFKVLDSGNVQNTNNSYGALSDIKLKENIVDATPKLADLMQVKVRSYNLKSDPLHKQLGVIAQELETVFPGLVDESPDYEEQTKTREVEVPAVAEVRDNEGNIVTEAVEATTKTEEYTEQVALGTKTKAVKYSVFVPMLIKAMQEQQALITQLQADVALLKGA
jgi:hypothetical protein